MGVAFGRDVVQEEFKVANDDKLTEPAFLDAAGLGHFDVALVGRSNAAGRIDAQRSFRLICRKWAERRDLVFAGHVARETADFADDALAAQADHERRAVVTLERRREGTDEELMRFRTQRQRACQR